MFSLILFIFGLTFGSFLNVVSFRYSPEKSLFSFRNLLGRSHCPQCGKTLNWYELVPVFSFLIQKGKCRSCGEKISWQYPLVELASGFIFLLPLYFYSPLINGQWSMDNGVLWVLAFLIFLLIWTIDYRLYLIPDELNISLAVLGFLKIISDSFYKQFSGFQGSFLGGYADLFGFRNNIWINHFWAALAGVLIVGLIIFITKGRGMGFGDLKLMSALGFLYGWPDILFIFVFASLIGSVISLFLVILKRKNFKSTVPFGPFLVLGAITIFFFGEKILSAYFNFLSSF